MVPPYMDSQPIIIIIPSIALGTILYSNDLERFKRFIYLGPCKFNGVIGKYAYEFLVDC